MLEVQLGDQTLVSYELKEDVDFEDDSLIPQEIEVPENLRGQMSSLTFTIFDVSFLDGSSVWLDNVGFVGSQEEIQVYLPLITGGDVSTTTLVLTK